MIGRRTATVVAVLALVSAAALVRRLSGHGSGEYVPGGILMPDAGSYDTHSRFLLGSLFRGIAADIAVAAPREARVLEVGSGPGHLSIRLARDHDLDVTALDLDPAMVERARANAGQLPVHVRRPTFVVGDVSALPFGDASFDLVVSTFSMHHWSDRTAGLSEIARVLRPDGKALVWDLKAGFAPFHVHAPDPLGPVHGSELSVVRVSPWRWPWRITFAERLELAPR